MTTRQRLPDRRGHELLDFEHGGIRYRAGVGRFEDGRLAEIFMNAAKPGTAVDTFARDAGRLFDGHVAPRPDAQWRRLRFGTAGARARSAGGVTVIWLAHRPHFGSGT
jgi:hypothetical protein